MFKWILWIFLVDNGFLTVMIMGELSLDCNFDAGSFCDWEAEGWLVGEEVAVDAFHSIPRTATGTDQFAYAQGHFGFAPEISKMRSPIISDLQASGRLMISYWKTAVAPTLEVCIEELNNLRCLDAISGTGQAQWTQREVMIPTSPLPFRLVIRARNLKAPIDLIGLDDIKFRMVEQSILETNTEKSEIRKKNVLSPIKDDEPVSSEREANEPALPFFEENNRFRRPEKPTPFQEAENSENAIGDPMPGTCPALHCQFADDSCNWTMSSEWQVNRGSALLEDNTASMLSASFLAPAEAFIDIDLTLSDAARLTVIEKFEIDENVIWTRRGLTGKGWHRLRIPIRTSTSPLRIEIRANATGNNFIQLTNTKLTDKDGFELHCEAMQSSAIKMQKLIAVQQTYTEQTPFSVEPPPPGIIEKYLSKEFYDGSTASNDHNASRKISQINSQPFSNRPLANSWGTSASPFHSKFPTFSQTDFNGNLNLNKNAIAPTSDLNPGLIDQLRGGNSNAVNELVQLISRQPAIATRLRSVAQQLGIPDIEVEKLGQLVARGIALQGSLPSSSSAPTVFRPPLDVQPIQPINSPHRVPAFAPNLQEASEHSLSRADELPNGQLTEHHSNILDGPLTAPAALPSPNDKPIVPVVSTSKNIADDFVKKLSTLISLPMPRKEVENPLAKENLDFIVKNALAGLTG